MKRLKAFWTAPILYFQTPKETWIFVISIGFFVFAFLTFFQPFGVNNYDPAERLSTIFVLAMLFFGLLTTLWFAFNEFIIKKRINLPPTQGATFLWIIWNVASLGTIMFFVYNYLGNWHDFKWKSYLEFIWNFSVTAIIPVALSLFYLYYKRAKNRLVSISTQNPPQASLIILLSENKKERLALRLAQIRYIESQDNYVAVFFEEEGKIKKKLLRSSLKRLEQQLESYPILRIHRSYMVNTSQLLGYTGNQHGLQLRVADIPSPLPVSRTYVSDTLKYFEAKEA